MKIINHKSFISVTAFLSLLFLSRIIAQEQSTAGRFTLEEAIQTALENNQEIKIAKMNVEKSSAAVGEAFGYALPSLDLSAGFSRFLRKPKMAFPDFEALLTNATYSILFDEEVIPRDENKFLPLQTKLQSFAQTNNYEAHLTATQILFSSAVFRGIGASQIYLDLSKEDLKNKVSETVLNVQKAFYGVLLTKELLEITQASFENAQDNLKTVTALYDNGFVSEFDQLQAKVSVENIRPSLLQIENVLKNTKNALKLAMGIDQNYDIDVEGEIAYQKEILLAEEDLIEQAMNSNYGIRTLQIKAQVDEAFIDLDRSEYWPTVAAFGDYLYAGSSDQWDFQNYSSFTVGVNFSINLFKGNQTSNRVEQSTLTYKQTEEQLKQLKDYVRLQVKEKILELERAQSLIEAQQQNVSVAERAYEIATVKYKEGTATQIEVQNADIALKQAKINLLQSLHSYTVTKLELGQVTGNTDSGYINHFENIE